MIGEALVLLRKRAGFEKAKDFAADKKKSPQWVSRRENAASLNMGIKKVQEYLDELGVGGADFAAALLEVHRFGPGGSPGGKATVAVEGLQSALADPEMGEHAEAMILGIVEIARRKRGGS